MNYVNSVILLIHQFKLLLNPYIMGVIIQP